jgi:hypothetical protein
MYVRRSRCHPEIPGGLGERAPFHPVRFSYTSHARQESRQRSVNLPRDILHHEAFISVQGVDPGPFDRIVRSTASRSTTVEIKRPTANDRCRQGYHIALRAIEPDPARQQVQNELRHQILGFPGTLAPQATEVTLRQAHQRSALFPNERFGQFRQ